MALTKDKIVDRLVEENGLNKREAKDFVDTFFDDIKERVSKGERVRLAGTGALFLKKQARQRKRRDTPVEGEWRIPSFMPYPALKGRVQGAGDD